MLSASRRALTIPQIATPLRATRIRTKTVVIRSPRPALEILWVHLLIIIMINDRRLRENHEVLSSPTLVSSLRKWPKLLAFQPFIDYCAGAPPGSPIAKGAHAHVSIPS